MDLDDQAARAADDLRRRVTHELDLPEARAAVQATAAARHRQRTALRLGGVVAVVAVVGVLAVAVAQRSTDPGREEATEVAGEDPTPDGDPEIAGDDEASAAAILGALPRGPVDGRDSWRLPVVAQPRAGLADGDVITVYGRGWEPHQSLGIVQCSAEAVTPDAGMDACELGADGSYSSITYTDAGADGTVVAEVVVRRTITTPQGGEVDCASAPERCLIGVGAINDYDRSGSTYIDFAGAPPFPEPSVTVTPDGPLEPGAAVTVDVTGWMPERAVRVEQCVDDRCQVLVDGRADGAGDLATTFAVGDVVRDGGGEVACGDRCVLRVHDTRVEGGSSSLLPADVPLSFTTEGGTPPRSGS